MVFMRFGVNVVFGITKDDKKKHSYDSLFRNVTKILSTKLVAHFLTCVFQILPD